MKILFITESFPYPLDSGGKIVSHQMLTMLSAKHDITLVALTDKHPSEKTLRAITSLGIMANIVISKKRNPWYKPSKTELLQGLLHGKPPAINSFYEEMFAGKVSSLLKEKHFDVIHVEHLSMAQYLPKIKTTTWIFQEQNIEYKLYRDFYRSSRLFSKEQLLHFCNYLFLSWYERAIVNRVDQIIVLSQQDKFELTSIGISPNKILVVPPYVKPQHNHPKGEKRNKELLFIGNLWWKPNLDAISWFLKDIFPLIQQRDPSIALTIVGEGTKILSSFVSSLSSVNLIEKPHDVSPYLKRASIFIMPFRIGQGVRIKALTAYSYGLPVVSTAIGMRGLATTPDKEYLLAETSEGFAKKIMALLNIQPLRQKLIKGASQILKTRHSRTYIQNRLLRKYNTLYLRP